MTAPQRPRAAAVVRNALSGGGRFVVAAAVALVVTPFALRTLGTELFGLWALAGALLATVRVLDLGLNRAVVRAIADAEGRNDPDAARSALSAARGLALLIGIVVVAIVWLVVDPLVSTVLHIPLDLQTLARQVLIGTACVAAIESAFSPFQSGLDGVGRMDVSNGVDTVQRVVSGAGTLVVLALGWGLVGLVWKNLATAILAGCAYVWTFRARAPELVRLRPDIDLAALRDLLSFGRHVQVVAVTAIVTDVGAKLLLGRVVGLDAVALYELAARVVTQVGGGVVAVAMALFPAAAAVHASTPELKSDALVAVYRRGTRYLGWLALPAFAITIVLSGPFVAAWLGTGFVPVQRAIAVLGLGWLVASLAMPAHLVAQAGGRPRISVWGAVTTAAAALVLCAVFVKPYGLAGVVGAVAAGLVVGAVVVWQRFAVSFGTGLSTIAAVGWRAPTSAAIGAACSYAVVAAVAAISLPPPGVKGSLFVVAAAGTIGLAAYGAVLHGTREVGRTDWALLREALSGPGARPQAPDRQRR